MVISRLFMYLPTKPVKDFNEEILHEFNPDALVKGFK